MPSPQSPESGSKPEHTPAVEHLSAAQELLESLRKKIGQHPELEEAIVKLETALSLLTVRTGGML